MPLSTLDAEEKDGLLHYIIGESNHDYHSVEKAYTCMGRSMNKRTTLLTVPHSKFGFGSKRAARGKLHFENDRFLNATVTYKQYAKTNSLSLVRSFLITATAKRHHHHSFSYTR